MIEMGNRKDDPMVHECSRCKRKFSGWAKLGSDEYSNFSNINAMHGYLCISCEKEKREEQHKAYEASKAAYHEQVLKHLGIGVAIIIVIIIIAAITSSGSKSGSGGGKDTDSYGHDKFDAMVIAEKAVKNQLKSPSSAKFCSTSAATITHSGNTWTVSGWVEAQNSFGATLRNNFRVRFTFNSQSNYTIESCSIS